MDFTLLQVLSGTLLERLNVSPEELLSAFNAISAMPVHPYEQAKYELFGSGQKFKTFQDIEVPESFTIETAKAELSSFSQNQDTSIMATLSAESLKHPEGIDTHKEIQIIDRDLAKKNIIFTEVIRTLTFDEIHADPEGVAKKVLSYYLSINKN